MRFFAYNGTDSQGRPTQGTIQAPSADEAQRLLLGGGVQTRAVRELSPTTKATAAVRPISTPVAQPAQVRTPAPVVKTAQATVSAPPTIFKFRFVGNKTSFFFFESLARYLRSGVAPNRALEELGQRTQKAWFGERLNWASEAVAKGMSLAESLEACACFPTGCTGTIRAGEASGAVPDACFQAATGCERAHKLGSRCAYMTIMFIFVALFLPFGLAAVRGSVDAMEAQADANSSLPAAKTAATSMWGQLKQILPWALPWWIFVLGSWRLWLIDPLKRFRHRMILLTPILSGRARDESLARISWALTELSRAGLSPARSMALAADASPNLLIADRFREESARMGEGTKLSTAIQATGLMEPQLVDVVENGELAGDVPGAIHSVHKATSAEFERKNDTAHTRIWFVLYPILGVTVAVIVGFLYKILYLGLFHAMFKDT